MCNFGRNNWDLIIEKLAALERAELDNFMHLQSMISFKCVDPITTNLHRSDLVMMMITSKRDYLILLDKSLESVQTFEPPHRSALFETFAEAN